ncbi:GAF domain-containing protein [Thermus thermophilus]|uniref:GAF domain-containing protein n=1 Tax=Thermus thermophilus TaxID=274 RepID=UPI001FCB36C4|nr:GAF domain-containing protein [Thermus thermophilus]BDG23924.1 hypothetical protein TthSNM33_11180 [Thermus thermophilus]
MAPQIANPDLKRVPMAKGGYGRWLRAFLENRAVSGPVRTFPQAERPLLEAQDIRSLLAVPVFWKGRLWGFLGVDDCRRERAFSAEEEAFLRTGAEVLALALDLVERHRHLERLLDQAPLYLARLDPEGRPLWANLAFRSAFPSPWARPSPKPWEAPRTPRAPPPGWWPPSWPWPRPWTSRLWPKGWRTRPPWPT